MSERLRKKGFADEEINSTVKFLEDTGLINDRTLASDLFRYSMGSRALGKRGIRALLLKRGIDRGLVDETLSDHTEESEQGSALEFVESRMRTLNKYPEDVVKRRLWGMLQRRGFSAGVIIKAINSVDLKNRSHY